MEKMAEFYIRRTFDLARLGAGSVSPNPMVGAVLVHGERVIGEGFHQRYGGPHAEVNAVASVRPQDRTLIPQATLYVSLEPCCIYGKTPPCTSLILEQRIPRVVISCLDLTPEVSGQGVRLLREHGVEVSTGVLEAEGRQLAASRNVSVTRQRPYVILKMASTADGFFAPADRSQFWISNPWSKRLVHRWRMETDAILVGTRTAMVDDPLLDNRLYFGKSPLRIVIDRHLVLPPTLKLFNDHKKTLIISAMSGTASADRSYLFNRFDAQHFWPEVLHQLWQEHKIGNLLIEGGADTLTSIINSGLWDEARIFIGDKYLQNGIPTPVIPGSPVQHFSLGKDQLMIYRNSPRS